MTSKWDGKVPVRYKDGSVLHDTDYMRGAPTREDVERDRAEMQKTHGSTTYAASYYWDEVKPFCASLQFKGISRSGHSVYSVWTAREGVSYPMLVTDLDNFLQHATLNDGWTEPLKWETVKRGTVFGIRRAK